MPAFPPEVWRLILKETRLANLDEWRKQELCKYSLVCTMWTPIAQGLMWEEVVLRDGNVARFLSSAGTGREVTKSITVDSDVDVRRRHQPVDAALLGRTLEKVRGLEKLVLGGEYFYLLGSQSLIGLKHLSLSDIHKITSSFVPIPKFELRSLSINDWGPTPFDIPPLPSTFLASSRLSLRRLEINTLCDVTLPLVQIFSPVLLELDIMEEASSRFPDAVSEAIQSCQTLKTLRYTTATKSLEGLETILNLLPTPLDSLNLVYTNWTAEELRSLVRATATSKALTHLTGISLKIRSRHWIKFHENTELLKAVEELGCTLHKIPDLPAVEPRVFEVAEARRAWGFV
ncbi:hypothetical protein RQP46_001354 [Phenoliferia psychrophenolica]